MAAASRAIPDFRLSTLRGLGATCLIMVYLLASAVHGVCDLDVTNPSGKSSIASLVGQKSGHSEQTGLTEHHCHGCFSVAVPQPPLSVAFFELFAMPNWSLLPGRAGLTPDADFPPPKHLI